MSILLSPHANVASASPSSSPSSSPFGVVEIRAAKENVAAELKITPPMRAMMEFIAAHGGEVPFSWHDFSPVRAQNPAHAQAIAGTRELIVDMINVQLLSEREYVRSALQVQGRLVLRLTDKGKSVVAALQRPTFVPGAIQPISAREIANELKEI